MSDPRRIVSDDDATEFQRRAVEDWLESEKPPLTARLKTLAALGLVAGAAGAAAASGSIAPKAASMGSIAWLKWSGMVIALTGATAAIVFGVQRSSPSASPSHAPAPSAASALGAPMAALSPDQPDAARPPESAVPTAAKAVEAVTTTSHGRGLAPSSRPAAGSPTPSLAAQLAMLDEAHRELDSGEPSRALRIVTDYESRYPTGAFMQEAEVLRVQAHVMRGERALADASARRLLSTYPSSPHAARVRALLDAGP